jgi:dTDP-4-dehydrorhamnose reductase|tara:strand:+ start:1986 stop:2858 length:873 start_codon:yes stop_codon:yes gene_type:complete
MLEDNNIVDNKVDVKTPNIFIFGSNGMLGNYVKSYLSKTYTIISFTRKDYDLSKLSIDTLTQLLKSKNIKENDIVINCAGVIPQASNQRGLNTRLYFTINSLFPVILSQICDKYEAKMIHITTDCVFSGKNGNYNENSIHDEINDYGLSKSLGELCKATIIRTSIIGEEIKNKRSLLEWVKSNSGNEINGYTNHYWNGVTCLHLSKIVEDIITKNNFWNGVRHIFSPKSVSKYELVSMINDIYNLNIKINKLETENSVNKTITSMYDNNFVIPDLFQQIKEMKEFNVLNM